MYEERFQKLLGTLDPIVQGFLDANPEWLEEDLGPVLTSAIPNYMVQDVLEQVVDLHIANLIAKGKIKVEGEMFCWVNAE